jgi:hypothetical protein
MKEKLATVKAYEEFIYTIQQAFPAIKASTLVLKRQGRTAAVLVGELLFERDIRLFVRERLDFAIEKILGYSYEVRQGADKLYWYDSQDHPNESTLAATRPHHKHIPPDLKHHRVPAPNLSFDQPNLPFLIQEIIDDLLMNAP